MIKKWLFSGNTSKTWTKIYNQDAPQDAFEKCKLDDCNIEVDKNNFINFDLLQKNSAGNYEFKIEWELNNVVQYMTWSQKENPLSAVEQEKVKKLVA